MDSKTAWDIVIKEIREECSLHAKCCECPMHDVCEPRFGALPYLTIERLRNTLYSDSTEDKKLLDEPTCPICGGYVEHCDTIDTDADEYDSTLVNKCIGRCTNCKKEFTYKEVYEYQGIKMGSEI